eukprot:scaffold18403_cov99-Isochrysis_galbana.AAC.3
MYDAPLARAASRVACVWRCWRFFGRASARTRVACVASGTRCVCLMRTGLAPPYIIIDLGVQDSSSPPTRSSTSASDASYLAPSADLPLTHRGSVTPLLPGHARSRSHSFSPFAVTSPALPAAPPAPALPRLHPVQGGRGDGDRAAVSRWVAQHGRLAVDCDCRHGSVSVGHRKRVVQALRVAGQWGEQFEDEPSRRVGAGLQLGQLQLPLLRRWHLRQQRGQLARLEAKFGAE